MSRATKFLGALAALALAADGVAEAPAVGTVLMTPTELILPRSGPVAAEEGLLIVPENRAVPGSRRIAVHFWRFRGRQPDAAPVIVLPGGPGSAVTRGPGRAYSGGYPGLESPWGERLIVGLAGGGDLLFVNQRGNANAPLQAGLRYVDGRPLALARVPAEAEIAQAARDQMEASLAAWPGRGVDLRGYDFPNIVEDLEDLRSALGYERLKLHGGSFGSQWALGYLKRHPDRVDRALLTGIEPLDCSYDSPAWVWAVIGRLAAQIDADPAWRREFPQGVLAALAEVQRRLTAAPATVPAAEAGAPAVQIDWRDVQRLLLAPLPGATLRQNLEGWPAFVRELAAGDYRRVAAAAVRARANRGGAALIGPLIDHSLDISRDRDGRFAVEAGQVPLGEINADYRRIRGRLPTADVGDVWRADFAVPAPLLMLQGDHDVSTPCENAELVLRQAARAKRVRVVRGTHDVQQEVAEWLPDLYRQAMAFLLAPVEELAARQAALPEQVELPPLRWVQPPAR